MELGGVTGVSNTSTNNFNMVWQASGQGSVLSIPNLATLSNGTAYQNDIYVNTLNGGTIDLPSVREITDPNSGDQRHRSIRLLSRDLGSVINLPALEQMADYNVGYLEDDYRPNGSSQYESEYSRLEQASGGSITLGSLTNVRGVFTTVKVLSTVTSFTSSRIDSGAGAVDLQQLTNGDGTDFNISGGTVDFSSLERADSAAFSVSGGVDLSFPSLARAQSASFSFNAGSVSLPNLSLVDGTSFYASGGVTITLPAVGNTVTNTGNMVWQASGQGSVLSIPNLATLSNGTAYQNDIYVNALNGGTIDLPSVREITDPNSGDQRHRSIRLLSRDLGSVINLPALEQMADYNVGYLEDDYRPNGSSQYESEYSRLEQASGGSITLGSLTNVRGVFTTVKVLSTVTSFTSSRIDSGAGAVDLQQLTNGDGTDFNISGGTVDFSSLERADSAAFSVSGGVDLSFPSLARAQSASFSFNAGSVSLPNLSLVDGTSFYASGGVTITLPAVGNTVTNTGNMVWQASGQGSVLSIPNLATLSNGTAYQNDIYVNALNGGTIDLPSVREITDPNSGDQRHRSIRLLSRDLGSVINLPALEQMADYNVGYLEDDYRPNGSSQYESEYSRLEQASGGSITLGSLTNVRGVFTTVKVLSTVTSFTSSRIDSGAGAVDLQQLTNGDGTDFNISGGTVDFSSLERADSAAFSVSGGVDLSFPSLARAQSASFSFNAGSVSLPNLSLVDGTSFYASGGVTITLPAVGNTVTNTGNMVWQASGQGSVLSIPNLATLSNGTAYQNDIYVNALNGGTIDLPSVREITDPNSGDQRHRSIRLLSRDLGSVINLPALEQMADYNVGYLEDDYRPNGSSQYESEYSRLQASGGGTIIVGNSTLPLRLRGIYVDRSTESELLFNGGIPGGPHQGAGAGLYSLSSSNVFNLGTFVSEGIIGTVGGNFDFNGSLILNGSGRLDLPPSGSMTLTGSLLGNTTHTGSRVLGAITLDGSGNVGNPQQIEVMGRDLGEAANAYTNNFVIHQLTLAGSTYAQLVDIADNTPGGGPEALYVNSLVVPVGATLDLNGLKLYARGAVIQGQILNGEVTQLADTGPIPINVPTPGTIGVAGELDVWTFFGRAGRQMTIWVNPGDNTVPASTGPLVGRVEVTLLNAAGTVIATGFSASDEQVVSLASILLPADGIYTIRVKAASAQATNTGNYLVAAWDSTPDVAAMQRNQRYAGQIETPFSVDRWTFSAQTNDQVRFDLLNRTNSSIVFDLTGPGGWSGFTGLGADSGLITLPADGTYTLTVRGTGGLYGGHYSFQMDAISRTDLAVGQLYTGSIVGNAHAQLFRVNVPQASPMLVRLDDLSGAANHNELYARFGAPPTRSVYDARFGNPAAPDQVLVLDRAMPGDWYILVYGDDIVTASSFTLQAVTSSVLVESITPERHGRAVNTIVTLTGAGFVPGSSVTLVGSGGLTYPATTAEVDSLTQITATFAANMLPLGVFDVRVEHPDGTSAVLPAALTMTDGSAAELRTNLVLPSVLGWHGTGQIVVEYENVGSVAMTSPLLHLTANVNGQEGAFLTLDGSLVTQGFWTSAVPEGFGHSVQFLATGGTPGVLQPGERGSVTVYYAGWQQPWSFGSRFNFQVNVTDTTNTTPIDWAAIKEPMRPSTINPEAWNAIYPNLIAQIGSTWGDYVRMLGENASYLGRLGQKVSDIGQLLSFEVQQAIGLNVVPSLATSTDAVVLGPGQDISFQRTYLTSLTQRNVVGPLGRGWVWISQWDETSNVRADGTIVISSLDGGERVFQPDSRSSTRYFSELDDYGTISNVQGKSLVLEEADGTQLRFDVSGRLASITDPNGNRIDATYVNGRLTRLTHSSGQWLQINYNSAGRIVRLLDPDGRETLFTYDAGNEQLMSVRNFDGRVTSYTYATGQGLAVDHAITSITPPTGVTTYFTYDAQGRFATISKANDVELTTFSYDTAGTVSLTTPPSAAGPGGTRRLFFDHKGRLARDQNELGFSTYLQYNALGNLLRLTDPDGRSTVYEYGREGLVTSVTDANGDTTRFAYDGPFNLMTSFTDANGNTTVYAYDAKGNLLSITDPAGHAERWTYDPRGNVATSTNRRNQTILYGYNIDGQLTSKTLPDGVSESFTYDVRGNLTSTVDPTGTTLYEYEAATDRLRKITYPGDQFLVFTYCACGRRESMTDELGYTLTYNYDTAGNLASLVDGNGVTQATYTYDVAGLLMGKELANGVHTTYRYDAARQILSLVNLAPDESVLSQFDYTYDARGLRTSMNTIEGLWDYDYDEIGQLTGWTAPNGSRTDYVYDALGNRLTETIDGVVTTYTVNNLNQYTQVATEAYIYDLDGNLVRETDGAVVTNYTYNVENRLTGVTRGSDSWSYFYDALGNRVTATEGGVTTRFVVDPFGYANVVGEYQGGSQVARNVYGFGLLVRQGPATTSFYTFQAIGSTSEITDAGGAIQANYNFTPFGVPLTTPAGPSNPYQFIGEYGIQRGTNGLLFLRLVT